MKNRYIALVLLLITALVSFSFNNVTNANSFFENIFEDLKAEIFQNIERRIDTKDSNLIPNKLVTETFPSMMCTGTGTVISNVDVPDAANATGTPNGNRASLYQANDAIVLDLGEVLSATTTITVTYQRISGSIPILNIQTSANAGSGFSDVTESPYTITTAQNVTATFTVTVPAGNQYLEIESDNGIDAGIDGITFTCPNGSGGGGNLPCSAGATEITGVVFEDFNYNGIYDSGEYLGIKGLPVTATDSLDNSFSATTASDGTYTISGLISDRTYRVEFTFPDSLAWAQPTFQGGDNGTVVQFLQTSNCANLGVSSPASYCQLNPELSTICFINGDGNTGDVNNNTHAAGLDVLVSFGYNDRGTGTAPNHLANASELGSVWGLVYERTQKKLFSSAFLKRHMEVGSNGLGMIYVTDPATATSTPFLDLATLGFDVGTISGRNLPMIASEQNRDSLAFTLIGEIGLGDLDISEDNTTLWVVNLKNKELISIDIENYLATGMTPTISEVSSIVIPNPGCSDGDYRPFGLGVNKGSVFVGVVCSAETSQTASDLRQIVYKFNPNTLTFTEVLNETLVYQKGGVHAKAGPNCQEFYPWTDEYDDVFFYEYIYGSSCYPQPMLTDIEFDTDGSLILGFCDRYGHQSGGSNYSVGTSRPIGYPDPAFADMGVNISSTSGIANPPTFDGQVGGEILKAFYDPNTSTYTLESNGSGGCGVGNGQGPGGGEFYCAETFTSNHEETAMGGLLHVPGTNQLIANVMDPLRILSGGIVWLSNSNGSATNSDRFEIYRTPRGDATTFSKAAGLGDIEAFCDPAPIEIGNFVWIDENGDGVQDPGESIAEGVTMELYDANGTLLASTITDAKGQYYFSDDATDNATWTTANDGLDFNSNYYIVAGGNGQYTGGLITLNGIDYELTSTDNASGTNADIIDNDGLIASGIDPDFDGEPYVQITTGNVGNVRHAYDFGFRLPVNCQLDISYTQANCTDNLDGTFTAIYDLVVSWSDAPAGDITLTHTGVGTLGTTTISAATIAGGNSTILGGTLTVNADGDGTTMVSAAFDTDATCNASFTLKAPVPCPTTLPISYPCSGNFALEGITSASSEAFGGFAAAAIDGQQTGDIHHSASEVDPWWQVTLAQNINVDSILVWNRTFQEARLNGAIIEVLNDAASVVFTTTITTANTSPSLENIQTGGVVGRTVRIRHNSGANEILNFFEVEVFGNTTCTGDVGDMCNLSSTSNVVGSVWNDANCNGIIDEPNTIGIQGVEVQLYDCDNNLAATTHTDANGNYQFTSLTAGTEYRVEFNMPESISCWATPTHAGTDNATNGTTVQFVEPGDCANLGLSSPIAYCQADAPLATTCYLNGAPTDASAVGDPAVLSVLSTASGDNPTTTYIADIPEVGSTYGLAYNRSNQELYASTVLKRHVGHADGLGTIYSLDPTGINAPTTFYDFGNLAGTIGARGLGSQTTQTHDTEAFYKAGRSGLGDIDISTDNSTLYVSNLEDGLIYSIATDSPAPNSAVALPPIPDPGCTVTDESPWWINIGDFGSTTYGGFEPWNWDADKYTAPYGRGVSWASGNGHGASPTTNNTDAPDEIFRTTVAQVDAYLSFPVPNASYSVSLYFMEHDVTSFPTDVYLDGTLVLDDYEVLTDAGGQYIAIQKDFAVTVTDGMLSINLERVSASGNIVLSGVKIVRTSPAVTSNTYRIWGLKAHDDGTGEKLYAGVVCSAENSGHKDDLSAHVYAYDPSSNSWEGPVLSFSLDYERQNYGGDSNSYSKGWHAWNSNYFDILYAYSEGNGGGGGNHAQAILSDIEFATNGDMILGFMDRGGMQFGADNYRPEAPYGPGGTTLISYVIAGDVLRAGLNNDNTWSIEQDGMTSGVQGERTTTMPLTIGSTNVPQAAAPGGKEFFWGEGFILGNIQHWEAAIGGLASYEPYSEIAMSSIDPTTNLNSGGVLYLDEFTGSKSRGVQVYDGAVVGSLAKSVGLGDVELLCNSAPLEIGNYVWCDSLENGIQDACERGIQGIKVQLFDRNGALVGVTTSSARGQYYFNQMNVDTTGVDAAGLANNAYTGMSYGTQYFIVFGESQFATDEFTVGSETYGITSIVNAGSNEDIDSDVNGTSLTTGSLGDRPDGLPFIDITTSTTGCGDHKYDLGVTCRDCAEITELINTRTICHSENVDTLAALTTFENPDSIAFVYFSSMQTDSSVIYIGGIGIDTLQISATSDTVRLTDVSGFTNTSNSTQQYFVYAIAHPAPSEANCRPYEEIIVNVNPVPTATAATTGATCTDSSANSDGTITLTGFSIGERYDFNTGNTYSGSATFASGSTAIPVDGIIVDNLANPSGSQVYTIRIFTSNECFVDRMVTLNETDCGAKIDYPDYNSNLRPCTEEPCHTVTANLYLGLSVSADATPVTGETADGDDDDGVSINSNMQFTPGNTVRIPVTIYNDTGNPAFLRMWIDWNADGDFQDAGEQVENNTYPSTGAANLVFVSVTIPVNATQTSAIALRTRLSTDDVNSADPCGNGNCAADGEIEDYLIQIDCPTPICPPVLLTTKSENP